MCWYLHMLNCRLSAKIFKFNYYLSYLLRIKSLNKKHKTKISYKILLLMLSSWTWILSLGSCIWRSRCNWSLASDPSSQLCGRMFSSSHLKMSTPWKASGFPCRSCCMTVAPYPVQFHMNSDQQRHLVVRLQRTIEGRDTPLTCINSTDSQ